MATKNVTVRMEEELKAQVEEVLDKLGLNMTTLILMTVKQVVLRGALPFDVTTKVDPKETEDEQR